MTARALAVLVAGLFGFAAAALAADVQKQESWAFGKDQYNARCAPCHGKDGKGHGPVSKQLGRTMPDLTTYARRNGGMFPTQLAWEAIDGRPYLGDDTPARQMPLFGVEFRADAQSGVEATAYPEWQVSERIAALVDYLATLQR